MYRRSSIYDWVNQRIRVTCKKVNSEIITTRCFLHREVLIGKTLNLDLTQALKEVIEMINYIKARPLKS